MKRTELLQEIRKIRFKDAYEGWHAGELTQSEAAQVLGMCERSFRRYLGRYEAEGLEGLIDQRLGGKLIYDIINLVPVDKPDLRSGE